MLLLLADLNVVLLLQEEKHSGFLNEAKEWAGELLSGQTKVGLWRQMFENWKNRNKVKDNNVQQIVESFWEGQQSGPMRCRKWRGRKVFNNGRTDKMYEWDSF